MWLCYVDESGNTGNKLDDPDQPVHWMAGVLVPEEKVLPLARDVEAIIAAALGTNYGKAELHGADLYGGNGPWAALSPAQRVQAYEQALALIEAHESWIVHASIDKPRLAARYNNPQSPHLLAIQFLLEKVSDFLNTQTDPTRQRALIVADESYEHEGFVVDLLAEMQRWGTGVVPSQRLDRIIDTAHFVPSFTNPGVQLADLVGYVLNRRRRLPSPAVKAADLAVQRLGGVVDSRTKRWRSTWPGPR